MQYHNFSMAQMIDSAVTVLYLYLIYILQTKSTFLASFEISTPAAFFTSGFDA